MSRTQQALVFLLLILSFATLTIAQSAPVPLPDPQIVQIPAADDLLLVGSFYTMPDMQAPTILFLHEPNASQDNWAAFVEPLWEAGYNMLLVDLRGYGETGGEADWEASTGDIQTWLDWLHEQPEVQTTGISIIGADLGGNLAVIGCENDSACLTAIAVSPVAMNCADRDCRVEIENVGEPAVTFLDEMTLHTVTKSSRRSSALLLSARNDTMSLEGIRSIGPSRSDRVEFTLTTGSGHGTTLTASILNIIQWLDGHTPTNLTADTIEALVAAGDPSNGAVLFAEGIAGAPREEGHFCMGCHYIDSEEKSHGPGLLNVGERAATRVDGESAAVYLYNSIVAPDNYIVDGFSGGNMPWRYEKGFTKEQIADLVAYLFTLEG